MEVALPFANTWTALQGHLTPGSVIPNWTASKGLLGDSFVVHALSPNHVEVDTPGAQNRQKVGIADFQTVYAIWGSYCLGQTPRASVRDATRYSKYVISIFNWLEQQLGRPLP